MDINTNEWRGMSSDGKVEIGMYLDPDPANPTLPNKIAAPNSIFPKM